MDQEKAYLSSLSDAVEDYFADKLPESIGEIYEAIGMPQSAVKEYLSTTDTSAVVRRICGQKARRIVAWVAGVILFCASLTVIVKCGLTLYGDQVVGNYVAPVYSDEGDRLE